MLLSFILVLLLSILVNPLLTSPGYCSHDLLIIVHPIHDFSECMTGIFSTFTGDDVICDSCLLDTSLCTVPYNQADSPLLSARIRSYFWQVHNVVPKPVVAIGLSGDLDIHKDNEVEATELYRPDGLVNLKPPSVTDVVDPDG